MDIFHRASPPGIHFFVNNGYFEVSSRASNYFIGLQWRKRKNGGAFNGSRLIHDNAKEQETVEPRYCRMQLIACTKVWWWWWFTSGTPPHTTLFFFSLFFSSLSL
jgi:hypothetical protein